MALKSRRSWYLVHVFYLSEMVPRCFEHYFKFFLFHILAMRFPWQHHGWVMNTYSIKKLQYVYIFVLSEKHDCAYIQKKEVQPKAWHSAST